MKKVPAMRARWLQAMENTHFAMTQGKIEKSVASAKESDSPSENSVGLRFLNSVSICFCLSFWKYGLKPNLVGHGTNKLNIV